MKSALNPTELDGKTVTFKIWMKEKGKKAKLTSLQDHGVFDAFDPNHKGLIRIDIVTRTHRLYMPRGLDKYVRESSDPNFDFQLFDPTVPA